MGKIEVFAELNGILSLTGLKLVCKCVSIYYGKTGLEGICVNRNVLEKEGRLELIEKSAPKTDQKMLVNLGPQMDGHEIVIKGT